jgi:hypothetical protein
LHLFFEIGTGTGSPPFHDLINLNFQFFAGIEVNYVSKKNLLKELKLKKLTLNGNKKEVFDFFNTEKEKIDTVIDFRIDPL